MTEKAIIMIVLIVLFVPAIYFLLDATQNKSRDANGEGFQHQVYKRS